MKLPSIMYICQKVVKMDKMDKIVKLAPFLYAALIYIGYLNYFFYYNVFDINILDYLTIGELLLSFLQLSIVFIIFGGIVAVPAIFAALLSLLIKEDKLYNEDDDDNDSYTPFHITKQFTILKQSIKSTGESIVTKISNIFFDVIRLARDILISVFFVLFFGFIFLQVFSSKSNLFYAPYTIVMSFFWILIFVKTIAVAKRRQKNIDFLKIQVVVVLVLVISLDNIIHRETAHEVLDGKSFMEVSLYFDNDTICTDSELLYIGQTEQYMFLYNKSNNTNQIYSKPGLKKIEMKKIDN